MVSASTLKSISDLKDIRFWLILFFFVRLYGITNPPTEFQHPWRQADGLMIARNFYERNANIFYPMVDIAGEKSGIVGSEFPLLNYLIYLVSLGFGYEHWYGRLIVLIVSTFGSLYFFKVLRKFFGDSVAFNATIILTTSLWFSYSRKIFPDCFGASLCIIALYFFFEYLESKKIRHLAFYFVLALFGCLSKISAATILATLAIPIFVMDFPLKQKVFACVASTIILASIFWWYFIWFPHLNEMYGFPNHFTTGCSFGVGWKEIQSNWFAVTWGLLIVPIKYIGAIIFTSSLIYVFYKKEWLIFSIFALAYFSFLVVILKTGSSIVADNYYILCAIPGMAFITGYTLAKISNKRLMWILVIGICAESIGDQVYDFKLHKSNISLDKLEAVMDTVSDRNDLIAINSWGTHDPTAMYFAHRRGWSVSTNIADTVFMNDLKAKGCKFVVIEKVKYGDVLLSYSQVHDSEYFRVYRLD